MVERRPEKAGVASSILAPGTTYACNRFPEKIYLAAGFETDLATFCGLAGPPVEPPARTRGDTSQDVGVLRDTAQQTNEIEWPASYLVT